jgi:uncharacterized protein YoxC
MRIDVFINPTGEVTRLDQILQQMRSITAQQESLMATLDQILDKVTAEQTSIDSLAMFIDGLKKQLSDALAGVNLTPAVQAKVDAIFAGVAANEAKVVAALDANVPPGQ